MDATQVQTFLNAQVATCRHGLHLPQDLHGSRRDPGCRPDVPRVHRLADRDRGSRSSPTSEQPAESTRRCCSCSSRRSRASSPTTGRPRPSTTRRPASSARTAPDCDPASTGFFKQVLGAAWQFKRYGTRRHPVVRLVPGRQGDRRAVFSTASCGSAPVAIWNKATAALYYYTPYQPNACRHSRTSSARATPAPRTATATSGASFTQWFGSPTAGSTPT